MNEMGMTNLLARKRKSTRAVVETAIELARRHRGSTWEALASNPLVRRDGTHGDASPADGLGMSRRERSRVRVRGTAGVRASGVERCGRVTVSRTSVLVHGAALTSRPRGRILWLIQ